MAPRITSVSCLPTAGGLRGLHGPRRRGNDLSPRDITLSLTLTLTLTSHVRVPTPALTLTRPVGWQVLGLGRDEYEKYARDVRVEYQHIPMDLYRKARTRIYMYMSP